MTDKELKDWCKTCNVEPPAMKFKCPECEHNPDKENRFVKDINVPGKEQIIIDGVQFNKFGDFFIDYDFNGKFQSISSSAKEYKILKSLIEQLARSNQIVEQQQKTLDELIGCVSIWEGFTEEESKLAKDSSIADLIMLLRERTQDYKNYKKQVEDFYKHMDRVRSWITQAAKDLGLDTEHSFGVEHFTFAVRCLKEEHEKLKQECEELKKQLEFVRTHRNVLDAELNRYRKALEEIKEELIFSPGYDKSFFQRVLNIISGFADGRNEMSPDSEQIEHTAAKSQMRNSVSVEQIQDNRAKREE